MTKYTWEVVEKFPITEDERRTSHDTMEEAHAYLRQHHYKYDSCAAGWARPGSADYAQIIRRKKK